MADGGEREISISAAQSNTLGTSHAQLEVLPDAVAVARRASELFIEAAAEAIRERGRFRAALSGGSTPKKTYELLASPESSAKIAWDKVDLFWGDERYVPSDDARSNYHMTRQAMLDRLPIPRENVHRTPTEISPPTAAAAAYDQEIRRCFGNQDAVLDLIFLGLGGNGHTASLFPHRPILHDTFIGVVADDIPEVSMCRITMTAPLLNRGRLVVFLVAGADKARVVREVIFGPRDIERLPAQLIQPDPGKLLWLLDPGAAKLIARSQSEDVAD
jgi:6-phosphogluconolactonase